VSTVPTDPSGQEPAHPHWCNPLLCAVGQPDASLLADHHLSTPRVLAAPAFGDVIVGLQLSMFGGQPLDETSTELEVTLTRTDGVSVEGYSFSAGQVLDLVAALGELVPAMTERPVRRRRPEAQAEGGA
jgi:hypothetical protein